MIARWLLGAAFAALASLAHAQSNYPSVGGATVPMVVSGCLDGSGKAIPATSAGTCLGAGGGGGGGDASAANQVITNTEIGALTETAPASDTASSGTNGRLQRIAQRLTSLITNLGAPGDTACASDTGSCTENALLQRLAQRLTSLIAQFPASLTASGADGVSNTLNGLQAYARLQMFNGTTWDRLIGDTTSGIWVNVKAATGLAQGSTTSGQTGSMVMGAVTTVAPSYTNAQTSPLSLTTAGGLRSDIASVGGSALALGSAASASSLPVTLPTDPDSRPSSGTITAQDSGSSSTTGQNSASIITGTATTNSFQTQAINGQASARILITGTWTGTLEVNGSLDGGTTWTPIPARVVGSVYTTSTVTGNGQLDTDVAGFTNVRVRSTASMTGTATVRFTFTREMGPVQVLNPIRIVDNTSGAQATVKAASTAPASTDTGIVVALRPDGATPYHLIAANTTNATNLKASAGTIFTISTGNIHATLPYYLKLYDVAGTPTCNTDTVKKTILIPPNFSGNNYTSAVGVAFANGIGICVTAGIADNDNVAVPAATVIANIDWK